MASQIAEMMNAMFKNSPKDPPGTPHDYVAERAGQEKMPLPPVPDGVSVEEVVVRGIDGERITPAEPNGFTIWYIHGGGFTTGSAKSRRMITFYLAEKCGYSVIANNYRLSPENRWPAQLDDCMTFYEGLLASGQDPSKLFLMGESAGATLVLSVALRAKAEGFPQPAGIAAFSPVTEQSVSLFPSHLKNIETDYMLGDALTRDDQMIAVLGTANPSKKMIQDPYFSPYYGDYTGLPPVFLSASDFEVLYDDAVMLHQKLKDEGHPCAIDIQSGVCHAYPMFPVMPEAVETIQKALTFLREQCME